MAFKQNGYRLPGQEGKFVWDKNNLPLAAMTILDYENRDTKMGTEEKESAVSRESLEFFSAGSVAPTVSYFFDYHFAQEDPATENYSATPGGTFIILNDLVPDGRVNLRFGAMSDEFLHLSAPRKTTLDDYLAPVSIDFMGVELNGYHPAKVRYAVGFGDDEVKVATVKNNLRGYYGWATYEVSETLLGLRYYSAKAGTAGPEKNHTQLDGNVDFRRGPWDLLLAYFTQANVDGAANDNQRNLLTEVIYVAGPKLLLTGRYELQDTESGGVKRPGTDRKMLFNLSYFAVPNMKMFTEYSRLKGHEEMDRDSDPLTPDTGLDEDVLKFGFQVGF
jgi:hypothetical protein